MKDFGLGLLTVIGGIITLAIWSVIVSPRSQAAQVIQAGASAVSAIVHAAVSPSATAATNGNLGASTWTTPQVGGAGQGAATVVSGVLNLVNKFGAGVTSV